MKEEFNFKLQIDEKETAKLRQSKRIEFEQVEQSMRDEYENRITQMVDTLKKQTVCVVFSCLK